MGSWRGSWRVKGGSGPWAGSKLGRLHYKGLQLSCLPSGTIGGPLNDCRRTRRGEGVERLRGSYPCVPASINAQFEAGPLIDKITGFVTDFCHSWLKRLSRQMPNTPSSTEGRKPWNDTASNAHNFQPDLTIPSSQFRRSDQLSSRLVMLAVPYRVLRQAHKQHYLPAITLRSCPPACTTCTFHAPNPLHSIAPGPSYMP